MLRLLLSLLFLGCHAVVAEPGLPIRGWSSWTQFRCHVNETLVLQMGRAIVDSGLAASGYNYVLLDDCWTACDKTPGSCFDADKGKGFCGKKGEWSGSCCRRDAVGEQQSPDCADRGCDGMHCCVADPS